MSGPISTAYVLIKARLDDKFGAQVNREVDAELKKIEAQSAAASKSISKEFDKVVRSVDADMAKIDAEVKKAFDSVGRSGDHAADEIGKSFDTLRAEFEKALTVEVGSDGTEVFDRLKVQIDSLRKDIEQDFAVNVDANVADAAAQLDALDALTKEIDRVINIHVETDAKKANADFLGTVQALQAEANKEAINLEIDSNARAKTAEIRAQIKALQAEIGRALVVDIDANTAAAEAKISVLTKKLALIDNHINVKVDVDTKDAGVAADGLFRKIQGVFGAASGPDGKKSFDTFGQLSFSLAKVGLAAGGVIASLVPVGPALAGIAAGAVAVVGAVGLAAGSMITAGVAASSLVLAFAALKVGTLGVGDALKLQTKAQAELAATGKVTEATQKKLDAALKGLAPSAREVVKQISSMSKAWSGVRKQVQGALFDKQAGNLKKLDAAFRPLIAKTLVQVSSLFSKSATDLTKFLTTGDRVKGFSKVFSGLTNVLKSLLPGIGNIGAAFGSLFSGSVGEAGDLAKSFTALTARFREFIAQAVASGKFQDFLDRAGKAAGTLFSVIGGLGKLLGGVFGAGAGAGVQLLSDFADKLSSVNDVIGSVAGKKALAGFFGNISVAGQALGDVMGVIQPLIGGVGDVLAALSPAIDKVRAALLPLAKALSTSLGSLLSSLAPTIAGLITSLVDALTPLVKVATDLAPVLAPLVLAFAAFTVGPIAAVAAAIVLFANALGKIIGQKAAVDVVVALGVAIGVFVGLQKIAAGMAALSAAIGIFGGALLGEGAAATFAAGATTALDAALAVLTLPVLAVVAAVAALVAGLVLAYKHNEKFRNIVNAVGKALKVAFVASFKAVVVAIKFVIGFVKKMGDKMLFLLGPIGAVIYAFKNFDKIKALVGKALGAVGKAFATLGPKILPALGKVTVFVLKVFGKLMLDLAKLVGQGLLAVVKFFFNLPFAILGGIYNVAVLLLKGVQLWFTKILPAIATGIAKVIVFFVTLGPKISAAIAALPGKLAALFVTVMTAIGTAVSTGVSKVVTFFRELPGKAVTALSSLGSKIGGAFSKAFSGAKDKVTSGIENIVSAIRGVPGKITALGGALKTAGSSFISKLFSGIKSGLSAAAGFAGDIGASIVRAIKNKLNDALNLPLTVKLPGVLGGKTFTILKKFAYGGVVDKATQALIGEAGREVVVPLTKGSSRIKQLVQESGLLNALSERDFNALILPRLDALSGGNQRVMSNVNNAGTTNSSRVVNIDRSTPARAQNVRSTVVQANFGLLATTDPNQQAEQVAARLARILER